MCERVRGGSGHLVLPALVIGFVLVATLHARLATQSLEAAPRQRLESLGLRDQGTSQTSDLSSRSEMTCASRAIVNERRATRVSG